MGERLKCPDCGHEMEIRRKVQLRVERLEGGAVGITLTEEGEEEDPKEITFVAGEHTAGKIACDLLRLIGEPVGRGKACDAQPPLDEAKRR